MPCDPLPPIRQAGRWRGWIGGTEASQIPGAQCPSYPLPFTSLSAGETPGVGGAHHLHHQHMCTREFLVPNPCPFTSQLPRCLATCQLREQRPELPLLREPGGEGRKVTVGVSMGWPLCGPPCLAIHGEMVPTLTPSHILFLAPEWLVHPSTGPCRTCPWPCADSAVFRGFSRRLQHLHSRTKNVGISIKCSNLGDILTICM